MNYAKVTEVRDLGPAAPADAETVASEARMDRMADLLRRYPHLEASERASLLDFLRNGRQLEIGLVTAREGIAARAMQFRKDHPHEFRLSLLQIVGFLALVLGPLTAIVWACLG